MKYTFKEKLNITSNKESGVSIESLNNRLNIDQYLLYQ